MDLKGWEDTNEALDGLESVISIDPKPAEEEDIRFITVHVRRENPAAVLNALGRAGLMTSARSFEVPLLKLIGQSTTPARKAGYGPSHYLTFEDVNHPESVYE